MSTETTPQNYAQLPVITFLDSVGRLIIAAVKPQDEGSECGDQAESKTIDTIAPAVVDIVQGQAPGTFGIRIVPLILTELLEDGNSRPTVKFVKAAINTTNAVLQPDIVANYRKTLQPPSPIITPETPSLVGATQMNPKQLF